MNEKHWFIAIVPHNTEKASYEKLKNIYEVFLPSQQYVSTWKDGRRKLRERILLPGKLLIHCTEAERQKSMVGFSFVKRYMVDIASAPNEFGRRKVAIVPDEQVERLRFILGQSEVSVLIDNEDLQPGEEVHVIRGSLQGLVGIVTNWTGAKTRIRISIQHLGCASIEVNIEDVERISNV